MTTIVINSGVPNAEGGVYPAYARVECVPTKVFEHNEYIVMPKPVTAYLKTSVNEIELLSSTAEWYWKITITTVGVNVFEGIYAIPDSVNPINIKNLTRLYTTPTPEWQTQLNQLIGLGGIPGEDGVDGKDGKNGLNGVNGLQGKQGIQGLPGLDGLNGANVLPTNAAILQSLQTDTAVKNELSATIGDKIAASGVGSRTLIPGALAIFRARVLTKDSAPVLIVGAGDSFVEGTNVSAVHRWVNLLAQSHSNQPVIFGWSALAGTTEFVNGVQFANVGRGGYTSATYLSAAEATTLGQKNPSIVIHVIGANDWPTTWSNPETLATNIGARIDAIDQASAFPVAHFVVHGHERYDAGIASSAYTWDDYLVARRTVMNGRPNALLIDIAAVFALLGAPGSDPLALMEADLLHVNEAGMAVYAQEFGELLGLPPAPPIVPIAYDTVLSDDFNRAEAVLHGSAAQTGQTWNVITSDWKTKANQAHGGTSSAAFALIDTTPETSNASMKMSVVLNYVGTVLGGPVFRALDTDNYFYLNVGATVAQIRKKVAGVDSLLATFSGDMLGTHNIVITLDGDRIDAVSEKFNLTATLTDPTTSATWNKVGLRGGGTWMTYDDLLVQVPQPTA